LVSFSAVVTTAYGYHIIKLIDKTPAQKVGYATIAARIKDFLIQQKNRKTRLGLSGQIEEGSGC
jgi:parvulin-like peptidyl-prolyl isomerase